MFIDFCTMSKTFNILSLGELSSTKLRCILPVSVGFTTSQVYAVIGKNFTARVT